MQAHHIYSPCFFFYALTSGAHISLGVLTVLLKFLLQSLYSYSDYKYLIIILIHKKEITETNNFYYTVKAPNVCQTLKRQIKKTEAVGAMHKL